MKQTRIVYMGTPDFAVYPLKLLVENGYNIVAVVTMPDKKAGRGQKITVSAVKEYALEQGLNILQPEKLKEESFLESLKALDPQLGIVVAFRMLPKEVWSMPKYGTFNLHASILPDYRGAAPINHAIINGDKQTGVTTFMLDEQIDTGDIILRRYVDIEEEDNVGSLHDKLMCIGGDLVLESVNKILDGKIQLINQENIETTNRRPAPKIFKEDCKIDWSCNVTAIHNKIRGLSPYPVAWSDFDGMYGDDISIKIYTTTAMAESHNYKYGTVLCDGRKEMKVACKDGFINILELQLAGKKRMSIKEFLNGIKLF